MQIWRERENLLEMIENNHISNGALNFFSHKVKVPEN